MSDTGNPLDRAEARPDRIRAAWRCGGFFGLAFALAFALIFVAQRFFGLGSNVDQVPGLPFLLPAELATAAVLVLIPSAVLAVTTGEPAIRFGFGRSDRLRQLGIGILTGLGGMSLLIGLMALLGGVRGWTLLLPPGAASLHFLGYAVVFSLVAIGEEGLVRGYGMVQLARIISFWPAAITTSVVFLLLHLGHQTESPVGLAQAGIIGLILAYSYRRTGALWFALGCHAAWDFAETYLYGVPDSGMTVPDALSRVDLDGPAWLTGGVTGPEASWLGLPVLAGMALVTRFVLPRCTGVAIPAGAAADDIETPRANPIS